MDNPIEFSKRSRKAILLFVLFLVIVVLIPRFVMLMQTPAAVKFSQTDFQKKAYLSVKQNRFQSKNYKSKKSKFKRPNSKFDPNSYAPSDWINLGLSEKQAAILVKFGKRGFYSHEDLKKVFVISDDFFALIKDSLVYPEKTTFKKTEKPSVASIVVVEINSAGEEELMKIKGIGSFFAKNIIKKRDALGGFISKEQLIEVWKMDSEKLYQIENFIEVDPDFIRKINVNTATAEELKAHPYFTWNVANSIVKLRQQLGGFQQLDDLKKSKLIDDDLFNKLAPYLML